MARENKTQTLEDINIEQLNIKDRTTEPSPVPDSDVGMTTSP